MMMVAGLLAVSGITQRQLSRAGGYYGKPDKDPWEWLAVVFGFAALVICLALAGTIALLVF